MVSLQRCSLDAEKQSFPMITELFCSQAVHLHVAPRAVLEQQAILARNTGKKEGIVTLYSVSYMETLLALKHCTWNDFWFLFCG